MPGPRNVSQVVPLRIPVDVANNIPGTEKTYEINTWLGQDLVSGAETHSIQVMANGNISIKQDFGWTQSWQPVI